MSWLEFPPSYWSAQVRRAKRAKKTPPGEGGPLEEPEEGPPESPPEDPAEGAARGQKDAIWIHFARKKYDEAAKLALVYIYETCELKEIVVSVCKGIDRYARNIHAPSRFGDPSVSSYLYILVR